MTASKPGLFVPRRQALLGAAAVAASPLAMPFICQGGRPDPHRRAARQDRPDRAADRISGARHLSRAGGTRQQDHGPAGRTGLAGRADPAGRARRTCRSWCRRIRSARSSAARSVSNALAEEATAAQLKIPFVCDNAAATEITGKNCNRYTFRLNTPVLVQSRMLAPLCADLRQEVVFHHRVVRLRAGHPALVARAAETGRRHRGGHR